MNTVYLQPPFALQRAEELISVNQMSEAFDILYATVSDKRFRNAHFDSAVQQDVMEKFLELAVLLDQLRVAREVASQYRSLCQHSFGVITALEHVLTHMREVAEKQVEDIKEDPTRLDSAISICIEVYKLIIEFARFSLRMQTVCHETVHSAFKFCCKYKLKNDFHRICDAIKSYNTMMLKMKQRGSARHMPLPGEEHRGSQLEIETNYYQLKYALKLNSWREIMQAAEDLYAVGLLDYVGMKPDSSVQVKQLYCTSISGYFECLAHYYAQVGMYSLHATAMMRWTEHLLNQYLGLSEREKTLICSVCVLAALSIGAHRGSKSKEECFDSAARRKHSELLSTAALLQQDKLIQFLRSKKIVERASKDVQSLLELVEDSHCFWIDIGASAMTMLEAIDREFANFESASLDEICLVDYGSYSNMVSRYFADIKRVIFRSTILKCSKVYQTIRLDHLKQYFTANNFMSPGTVLIELVNLDDDLGLHLQIDAKNNS